MIKNYRTVMNCRYILPAVIFMLSAVSGFAQLTTMTYTFTGSMQSFTVPSCVADVTITAKGAKGAHNSASTTVGGNGGVAFGVLPVTAGDVLNIYVGGTNGYNGGGNGGTCSGCASAGGGNGGGASDVRLNGVGLANRIIVGAGGGGGGGDRIPTCGRGAGGGGGAGYYGGGGGAGWGGSTAGGTVASGGSQTAGGTGGTSTYNTINNGFAGSLGLGGHGGGEVGSGQGTPQHNSYNGGVGGGATGAVGVGPFVASYWVGQSGAGGSSFTGTLSSGSTTAGANAGNGVVEISYTFVGGVVAASPTSTTICSGNSININTSGPVLSYTWNNGSNASSINVSPTSNTVYVVSSTNSVNCISTASVFVTVNPGVPVLSVISSTNSTCLGKTATLTASGATTYSWTNNVINGVSFTPSVTTTYVVTGGNACGTSTAATSITISPLPVTLIATPTLVCAGDIATLNAAAPATTYSWMPTNAVNSTGSLVVSPIAPTVYTLAVSDGTCGGTATVAVGVNPIPTLNISPNFTTVCQGDVVTLTASGGLNYTWTPGNLSGSTVTFSPLAPSAYSVGADNSFGCYSGTTAIIITNPSPTLSLLANSNLICSGESVTLTASGATSYTWTGNVTGSVNVGTPANTTVYSVSGELNGCTSTETVQIDVFIPNPAISGNTVVCEGQSSNLTATGANSYTWNPGNVPFSGISITPSTTTIYTLTTLTSSGSINCAAEHTVQVTVNPKPNVLASPDRSLMCKGETGTITASGANSYAWSSGGNGSSIVITSSLVTVLNFTVTGTGSNGCTKAVTTLVTVSSCNGINESESGVSSIKVYPNPSSGNVTLQSESTMHLDIVNQLGQVIKTVTLNEYNDYQTNVSDLSKGLYYITGTESANRVSFKLIVE